MSRDKQKTYTALISSDWNQCLAPCGPFDIITFVYPELKSEINDVFAAYTGNRTTLGSAVTRIAALIPKPITAKQMDDYLDDSFQTYTGVIELIEWCLNNGFLFMINTTGAIGYFQRLFARGLLPRIPVMAANPMIRFASSGNDPRFYELNETSDKGKYSGEVLKSFHIDRKNVIVIGDSGGDGSHFQWAAEHACTTIGSMTKKSLLDYCERENITIDLKFGPVYSQGAARDVSREMAFDFMKLRSVFKSFTKD